MFTTNKTATWLDGKSVEEKEQLFAMARKVSPQHQRAFKERQKTIQQERQEILRMKQLEMERQQKRALQKREKYTNEVIDYGLWQSEQEVHAYRFAEPDQVPASYCSEDSTWLQEECVAAIASRQDSISVCLSGKFVRSFCEHGSEVHGQV